MCIINLLPGRPSPIPTMPTESSGSNNISVAIRVRPVSGSATGSQAPEEPWQVTPSSLTHIIYDGQRLVCAGPQFTFDRVFPQTIRDNAVIFESVAKKIIDSAIEGINGNIPCR